MTEKGTQGSMYENEDEIYEGRLLHILKSHIIYKSDFNNIQNKISHLAQKFFGILNLTKFSPT